LNNKYFKVVTKVNFVRITLFVTTLSLLMSCGTSRQGTSDNASTIEVRITPQFVTLAGGATQLFQGKETTTTPNGSSSSAAIILDPGAFTWEVKEGPAGGKLAPSPTQPAFYQYTAPFAPGVYHVVITSRRAPTQNDVAEVTVK
jgi:hypothetical protein